MTEGSEERWLPVADYPGYEISDHGQAQSLDREVMSRWGTPKRLKGRTLSQSLVGGSEGHRYWSVTLYRDGKPKQAMIHVLMLEAFVSPRPDGLQGCHDDDDPNHNLLGNLYWGTPSQNGHDAVRNQRNQKANATECPQHHPYDEANTYIIPSTGHRMCRACVRAKSKGNANGDRTQCPQGHDYTPENTYVTKDGKRQCKECNRTRSRERQREKRRILREG